MKTRNNSLKCKEVISYCTVLLKLTEKFSLTASQPKTLAPLSAYHFLGIFGYVQLPTDRTPKILLPFINCLGESNTKRSVKISSGISQEGT